MMTCGTAIAGLAQTHPNGTSEKLAPSHSLEALRSRIQRFHQSEAAMKAKVTESDSVVAQSLDELKHQVLGQLKGHPTELHQEEQLLQQASKAAAQLVDMQAAVFGPNRRAGALLQAQKTALHLRDLVTQAEHVVA
eukprot:CAMPEP_0172733738 /NCGR_PEP_ID=MMETSP1074-20121228/107952_1 /TAXON_ID=2916 /ORGANISM="Ceratium fusus, Strain PA161109" /LENGTH=135 /DNA_ID=CAMNT_0013562359 /DNA_START=21 /DNA_END=425 /DNA_ORIENTATION=+